MDGQEITADNEEKKFDYLWLTSCLLVTAIASFLRFYWLELKPLHHDEGVNGYFLTTLFREGRYQYDPGNYHGPDLYYIALMFSKIFGLNTLSIRSSVAIFGVLTVILAFFLKKYIGKTGSLFAALFLALSPGMVYISRYFIHEILFVFFSFGIVVSILYFIKRRKAGILAIAWTTLLLLVCFIPSAIRLADNIGRDDITLVWILRAGFFLVEAALVFVVMRMLLAWNDGRPIYVILAAASTMMLFATKETAFITIGTMAMACLAVWLREEIARAAKDKNKLTRVFLIVNIPLALALIGLRYKFPEMIGDLADTLNTKLSFGNAAVISFLCYLLLFLFPSLLIWLISQYDILMNSYEQLNSSEFVEPDLHTFQEKLGSQTDMILLASAAAFVFIYVGVLFFSSFFTYPEGVLGFFKAYAIWTKTGTGDHTQNGFWAYLRWGKQVEAPIMILSVVGFLIALLKVRHRFALFAGFWAFGLFVAYTIIPYKTPWLALSFLLPMCIAAGYAINETLGAKDLGLKILGGMMAVVATGILGYQTYDLNFVRYDDDSMPYVYAHTKRGFLDLVKQIEYYADKSGVGKKAKIEIVSPDYWPMPWYMNDYPSAVFGGKMVDANTAEMIVMKKDEQDAEAIERYSAHYKYVGTYPLRPGVDLRLLVRKDLADSDAKELIEMEDE